MVHDDRSFPLDIPVSCRAHIPKSQSALRSRICRHLWRICFILVGIHHHLFLALLSRRPSTSYLLRNYCFGIQSHVLVRKWKTECKSMISFRIHVTQPVQCTALCLACVHCLTANCDSCWPDVFTHNYVAHLLPWPCSCATQKPYWCSFSTWTLGMT